MAASSSPPTAANRPSGSRSAIAFLWYASASSMMAILCVRIAPFTPVPGPAQSAPLPPGLAARGLVLPCQAASHSAVPPSRPSAPGGLVSSGWRRTPSVVAARSGPGRSRRMRRISSKVADINVLVGRSSRARTILYSAYHGQPPLMTNPNEPPFGATTGGRPSSFDEWLQAFKEQASVFTCLRLDVGVPRWQLADVLPVLPFIGAGVGLAAGLVFVVVRW